jgi:hypothetical protein
MAKPVTLRMHEDTATWLAKNDPQHKRWTCVSQECDKHCYEKMEDSMVITGNTDSFVKPLDDDNDDMQEEDGKVPDALGAVKRSRAYSINLGDDVIAHPGQAHFNRTGVTPIDKDDTALQQWVFDHLPLSQIGKRKLYYWLLENHQKEDDERCQRAGSPEPSPDEVGDPVSEIHGL